MWKLVASLRTAAEIERMETESGIKYSPYFDPIRFTIVDPMHNLFLGTAKMMLKKIWLERGLITTLAYCKPMTVPSDIGRIPRKIMSSFGGFTAEQWKNWVTIYSMFALRGVLLQNDYVCWQTFVLACFFLCRTVITHTDIIKADLLY